MLGKICELQTAIEEQKIDSSPCVRRTLLLGLHLTGMHGWKRSCICEFFVCLSSFQCSFFSQPCNFLCFNSSLPRHLILYTRKSWWCILPIQAGQLWNEQHETEPEGQSELYCVGLYLYYMYTCALKCLYLVFYNNNISHDNVKTMWKRSHTEMNLQRIITWICNAPHLYGALCKVLADLLSSLTLTALIALFLCCTRQ